MSGAISTTVKSFCLSTSQHGFRFMYLEKRTLFERCLWLILIILCLIGIILYAWLVYVSYRDQLIMITTDTTNYPIWNYEFPAVTICNTNKISVSKIKSTLHLFTNFSGTDYNSTSLKDDLSHLYDIIHAEDGWHNIKQLQQVLDNNNVTVNELFRSISPDCSVLVNCKWKGEIIRCNRIFQKVLTVHGFCCSFNYFAVDNASAFNKGKKPHRVSQCGYKAGLQVVLDTKRNDYAAFDLHTPGFYIFIHSPYDYLDWSNEFIALSQSSSNFISISASAIFTTDTLLSKDPIDRKCYFNTEKNLKGFNEYTYTNCLLGCRMAYMLEECNCMPYFFTVPTESKKTCTLLDIPCMLRVKRKMLSTNPLRIKKCDCLADCQHTEYRISYSGSWLPTKYNYYTSSLGSQSDFTNHTVARVFFNDLVFLRDKNDSQYNLPSLLAMLGGILGLFNGISITSIVEIIYFFIVRLYFNRRDQQIKRDAQINQDVQIFTVQPRSIFNTEYKPIRTPRVMTVNWLP